MSLSQIELVWVRVRVEWECFWVNLREDNKMSESKMAVSKSNIAEFKMAAIIKLSQNEWVKVFCAIGRNQSQQVWVSLRGNTKMAESNMVEFKLAAIIRTSENDEFESDWISLSQSQSGVRVFLSESERRYQGVWIQDGRVQIQQDRFQDGLDHQVESKWMREVLLCANWPNLGCQNSRWLPSSS